MMRRCRSRCDRCGCCTKKNRALRARLFVAVLQSAYISAQLWQLVVRYTGSPVVNISEAGCWRVEISSGSPTSWS